MKPISARWQQGHGMRSETSDTHSSSSSLGWMMDGGSGATSTEGSMENAPMPTSSTLERELMELPLAAVASESDETFIALPDLINRLFTTIVSTESESASGLADDRRPICANFLHHLSPLLPTARPHEGVSRALR